MMLGETPEIVTDQRCLLRRLGFLVTKVWSVAPPSIFSKSMLFYRPDHMGLVVRLCWTRCWRLKNLGYKVSLKDSDLGGKCCTYHAVCGCSLFNVALRCLYFLMQHSIVIWKRNFYQKSALGINFPSDLSDEKKV